MTRAARLRIVGIAVAAAVVLIASAIVAPRQAAAGWLIGFLFWSQIPVGSLVLLMIHTLTGGRWGWALRPVLAPATASVPWLFIAMIPVFATVPALYPWAHATAAVETDVAAHYLNVPFFIGRSLIALAVWSVLAVLVLRAPLRGGLLTAGIGLALYGLTVSIAAIDWFLSIEPPFVSSSFGASVGIMQLTTAMAWAALLAPAPDADPAVADVGGLLLAFVLGITYVDFMALLVIWYGDLPRKVLWFVIRDRFPWTAIAGAWFVLGSVVPIMSLLLARVRRSRLALRAVAASTLTGSLLYTAYLIAPTFGAAALLTALLSVIVIGVVQTMLIVARPLRRANAGAPAHGC